MQRTKILPWAMLLVLAVVVACHSISQILISDVAALATKTSTGTRNMATNDENVDNQVQVTATATQQLPEAPLVSLVTAFSSNHLMNLSFYRMRFNTS